MATRHATRGMMATPDHLASSAGVAMLRAGGNAVDAALAANAVLSVTAPNNCGLGGDLWAIVHQEGEAPICLDASGRAGSGADPDRLRAEGHREMPFRGDIRSVPVPGCVDGWWALHQRFGRLPLATVLSDAVALAEEGFAASLLLAATVGELASVPAGAHLMPGGRPPRPGQRLRRPGMARTLNAIAEGGRDAFYLGPFGEALLALGAGEYSRDDLAEPLARWVEPLLVDAWGHRVWSTPPTSQGYVTALGAAIASGHDLPRDESDPQWPHLLVEAAKAAGFDRLDRLGESANGPALVGPEEIARRRRFVDPATASESGAPAADGDTVYLCAVDRDRMAVSLIQSNAAGFGSHLGVESLGILLQNRGIGFSLEPGHLAEYGPGRRPPHTLAPALVTHPDGRLAAVLGTMGGDSQPQVVLQMLARLLGAGLPAEEAVARPRWALTTPSSRGFETWTDPAHLTVSVEPGAPTTWLPGLEARGHRVQLGGVPHYGHAHAIVRTPDDVLAGASDHRSIIGAATGW